MNKSEKREVFGQVCQAHDGSIILAVETIQEVINKMDKLDAELINDLLQIVIAKHYDIEEDEEMLRKKYNYSIFDQIENEDKEQ